MLHNYDVIVVGSGIAGLSFAIKVAEAGQRVAIITKKDSAESNTNYAQGGIAAVTSQTDDVEMHVADTLGAGDGLCDESAVRIILQDGPESIEELAHRGVEFTQLDDGRVSLGKEGGHSKRRILHVKDVTGKAIEEALLHAVAENANIETFEHHFAVELITKAKLRRRGYDVPTDSDRVIGLYVHNSATEKVETFSANAVLLATGGIGQVYQYTTNPGIATGDGIAMAYRAGVEVRNMEFIQFHPTAFYSTEGNRFLISEAVRGEGAILRNFEGEAFMHRYDDRKDLAPRDIVARAIDTEMKQAGIPHVWLDVRHMAADESRERFPNIYNYCLEQGISLEKDMIPVVPAAHYLCGGVKTDLSGKTSLPGLYACGEVACTGLHGANRLASNSLLEAVVMAKRGARAVSRYIKSRDFHEHPIPEWIDGDYRDSDERVILLHNRDELKRTLWDYVSIVRTDKRLKRALTRIRNLEREIEEYYWNFKVEEGLLELRNMVVVARLVIECALQRKESRGLHCTLDYPERAATLMNTECIQEMDTV
ncbi:L-aspartate oxidase [Coraliomargarita akajimensis]|uniref:L-aspartate oxidase n=1 Tax=Coraliomargarita akajimensis (strain DSM 45221 / IAM 15411 / JCM 23193 / KCTC 12865 / 04OKA010-24) TaxID=583355 RepID=D5EM91_CORAD|nr:L-aspartate oxidase [Coraliomargarita akajimensis]ADE55251.1 L-aspartate oxidase [Coraliomargarita akajimensis DSM 45221]